MQNYLFLPLDQFPEKIASDFALIFGTAVLVVADRCVIYSNMPNFPAHHRGHTTDFKGGRGEVGRIREREKITKKKKREERTRYV